MFTKANRLTYRAGECGGGATILFIGGYVIGLQCSGYLLEANYNSAQSMSVLEFAGSCVTLILLTKAEVCGLPYLLPSFCITVMRGGSAAWGFFLC